MSQHSIDLLPESMRARTQAGLVASRNCAIGAIALAALIAVTTHSRFHLSSVQKEHQAAQDEARMIREHEAKATELERALASHRSWLDRYRRVSTPLPISGVMATIVAELPPSVTLETMDFNAGSASRPAALRGGPDAPPPPRRLVVELLGFAADDDDIATLVSRLEQRTPFEKVGLDFSRQRTVRDRTAREFRLSLVVDLDRAYDVREADAALAREEGDDVG